MFRRVILAFAALAAPAGIGGARLDEALSRGEADSSYNTAVFPERSMVTRLAAARLVTQQAGEETEQDKDKKMKADDREGAAPPDAAADKAKARGGKRRRPEATAEQKRKAREAAATKGILPSAASEEEDQEADEAKGGLMAEHNDEDDEVTTILMQAELDQTAQELRAHMASMDNQQTQPMMLPPISKDTRPSNEVLCPRWQPNGCKLLRRTSTGDVIEIIGRDRKHYAAKVMRKSSPVEFQRTLSVMRHFSAPQFHDHFVQLRGHGFGTDRGSGTRRPFYTMELGRGHMTTLINGSIFRQFARQFTAHLLCGLKRMHDSGFLLMDVRRESVIVFDPKEAGGLPVLKFADYDAACMAPGMFSSESEGGDMSCTARAPVISPQNFAPELWSLTISGKIKSISQSEGMAGDMYSLGWLVLRAASEDMPALSAQWKAVDTATSDLGQAVMVNRQHPPSSVHRGRNDRSPDWRKRAQVLADNHRVFNVLAEDGFRLLPPDVQAIVQFLLSPQPRHRGKPADHLGYLGATC